MLGLYVTYPLKSPRPLAAPLAISTHECSSQQGLTMLCAKLPIRFCQPPRCPIRFLSSGDSVNLCACQRLAAYPSEVVGKPYAGSFIFGMLPEAFTSDHDRYRRLRDKIV